MTLSLTLLGGFQARLGSGGALSLPTRKTQALLAYLGIRPGHAHPRDKLAALLWSESSDERARDGLRHALAALRRAFPATMPPVLLVEGQTLVLSPAVVNVDVPTFERHAAEGTPEALEQAAAIYTGDLLSGFSLNEPLFEEWLVPERERLRELALDALAKLLVHQRSKQSADVALATALRLIQLDPLQEAGHRTLMRIYAQLGRRGAALRQYQLCVSVLQRELGVEPEEETKQLYHDVLGSGRRVDRLWVGGVPVAAPSPSTFRMPAVARDIPLVGREQEMARLGAVLNQAGRGEGHVVIVQGEAGVGKSRLVAELVNDASKSDCRAMLGRCYESERILPFGPWVDAFRAAGVEYGLDEINALAPQWRGQLARLVPELGSGALENDAGLPDYLGLFEAVAQLLTALISRRPLLLILEDLHWADEMSLRLLAFLTRRLQTWRALLVVTTRQEELIDAPMLRRTLEDVGRAPHVVRLGLPPLSRAATVSLVRILAQSRCDGSVLAQLGEDIWHTSEGNPFVVVEAMRALDDWRPSAGSATLPLPARVHQVIAQRLDRLGERSRQLVSLAAIIGREFEFVLLLRAAAIDELEVVHGLEELVRRHLLQAVGERFDFTHDRIREVAYLELLAPRRRLLHRAVAEALEGLHGENLAVHSLALGLHYRSAEVWNKAVVHLRAAGAAAITRSAYREAAACFEQALSSATHLPHEGETTELTIDLQLALYETFLALGDLPRLFEALSEAEILAKAAGDWGRLGRIWSGMAQYFRLAGDPERAIETGQRALSTAQHLADHVLEADTNYRLAQACRSQGNYRQAAWFLSRNIDLLEGSGLPDPPSRVPDILVLSRIQLAHCFGELGEMHRAIATGQHALRLAESMKRDDLIAGAHCGLGTAYLAKGEVDNAIAALEYCCRLCHLRELRILLVWAESPLGHAYRMAGRLDEAVGCLERAVERAAFLKHSQAARVVQLAYGYLDQGRLTKALESARSSLDLARQHKERGHEGLALRLFGEIYARYDPPEDKLAWTYYRQALEQANDLGMRPLAAHSHPGIGKLCLRTGKADQAHEYFTTATAMYREMDMGFWLEQVERDGFLT